ncbi:peptidyl-prolyl cis-trans isomerase [Geomonas sp. RF6]|uniref:peptidylprolyl isomerase n=1 Tax=Geomonas sp. RF6 TaxID=2897342 RepID=UPI001E3248E1|nr:peptidyl-prolyl cis-trans isomerase [Geomonas sp. RF6]UFS68827.1 peptidyl-prolyl cis-trans isomerase [Geomonas sp. RF6]
MKKINLLIAIVALSSATFPLAGCKSADISKSSQVLARVGDKEITSVYFERQLSELPESVRELSSHGEGKKAVLEGLVNRELLYEKAVKKHLDNDTDVLRKLEDLKKELIIKTLLQNELSGKVAVDDREVENFYNSHPDEFQRREEVRISQIVVPDQAKANEMMEKLSIKREFGELAAANSIDQPTAERNGDVGWFTRGKLPAELRDTIFKLGTGEVSQPIKMGNAYEIYKVTDRRSTSYEFAKVKDVIRAQLVEEKTQKELQKLVEGLKKETTVQLNEQMLR